MPHVTVRTDDGFATALSRAVEEIERRSTEHITRGQFIVDEMACTLDHKHLGCR